MPLQLVKPPSYAGRNGIAHIRELQTALTKAVNADDWDEVRRLDQICMQVIDRVIAAHQAENKTCLLSVLDELKDAYSIMIVQCKHEVASTAH